MPIDKTTRTDLDRYVVLFTIECKKNISDNIRYCRIIVDKIIPIIKLHGAQNFTFRGTFSKI